MLPSLENCPNKQNIVFVILLLQENSYKYFHTKDPFITILVYLLLKVGRIVWGGKFIKPSEPHQQEETRAV